MGDGYSRRPKMLKGAIIQFKKLAIVPVPNIIPFQYNPESLQRNMVPYEPKEKDPTEKPADSAKESEGLAQPFDPTETFTLNLLLDAADALEDPVRHAVTFVTGVADRLAALEMLYYPLPDSFSLAGSPNAAVGAIGSASIPLLGKVVQRREVPVILFVWGPGRIVPVRLTSFNVDEQQFNTLLYPHRARVTIGMKVLTADALGDTDTPGDVGKDIARFCYEFTLKQKQLLAAAALGEAALTAATDIGDAVLSSLPL